MTNTRKYIELTNKIIVGIFDRIAEGESMNSICKEPGMPSRKALLERIAKDELVRKLYEVAIDQRTEVHAEEIIEIADDGTNDWMESHDPDNPGYRANGEHINRSRLRIDARKWIASKLKPKKYGEKIQQEVSGPDGGAIPHVVSIKFVKPENNE